MRAPGYDPSGASPAFRPLAEQLLAASVSDRQAIWNEFLARSSRAGRRYRATPEPGPGPVQLPAILPAERTDQSAAAALAPARPGRGVKMTRVDQFEPRAIDWLWAGRVPLGMITMFAGDPKLGKSYVTLAMAAALSRGLACRRATCPSRPASSILMSAEDDPARTIAPRLVAAGADLVEDPHPRIDHPGQRQRDAPQPAGRHQRHPHGGRSPG